MTDRRTFLKGILTLTATAALPINVVLADVPILTGDGVADDTAALNALLAGLPFRTADGFCGIAQSGKVEGGRFRTTAPIRITGDGIRMNCAIFADHDGVALIFDGARDAFIQTLEGGPNSQGIQFHFDGEAA